MIRPDIEDLKSEILANPHIPLISYAALRLIQYIEYLEELDRSRDWPTNLHEQYLVVLDERDALQEKIDELETDKAILKREKSILMRELTNFTNNA